MLWGNNKGLNKIMLVLIATTLIGVTFLSGCVEERNTVSIKGSSTVLPIAAACAEEFMKIREDIQVTVTGGGSSVGIKTVAKGEVDIGDASRAAKPSDVENIGGVEFKDLVDHVVAYDGIAVVVSPNIYNSVTGLTMEQTYKIYTGEISNWNELDGPDLEIYVNDRGSTSGTRATFVELIKNNSGYALEDFEKDGGTLAVNDAHQENSGVVTAISGSQQAIGYVGLGYVNPDTCPAIEIDGVYPSSTTVKDETYPISRALHMYTLGEATGEVKDFIDYVQSDAGQEIVEQEGFIKIS